MEKTIEIGGKKIRLRATAALPRLYRSIFGSDIMQDMSALSKAFIEVMESQNAEGEGVKIEFTPELLTKFENMSYAMAKLADPAIPDTADEWLDTIELFSIYAIMPVIFELWDLNLATTAIEKKKSRQTTREITGAAFMLRCCELGLSNRDCEGMTMGMVIDMLIERGNDYEEYDLVATQEDFDRFRGRAK